VQQIQREAIGDTVAKRIRSAILDGSLAPGSRIRQEELAEQFAVSRLPVREALRVLESEGLVRSDRWRGTIVTPLEVSLIRDLYEFRGIIEPEVAATLAARSDLKTEKIHKVVEAGRAATRKKNVLRLVDLDLEFHSLLYEATGNAVLTDVMRGQWTHIRRVMSGTLAMAGYPQQVWDEHGSILQAIEEHDPKLAATRSLEHTTSASGRLIKCLERQLASPDEPKETL